MSTSPTYAGELAEEGVVLRRAGPVGQSGRLDHEAVRIGVCLGRLHVGMHVHVPQEVGVALWCEARAVVPFEDAVATER